MRSIILAALAFGLLGPVTNATYAATDQSPPPASEESGGHQCERSKGEPQTS